MYGKPSYVDGMNYVPKSKAKKTSRRSSVPFRPSYNVSKPNTVENKYYLGDIWLGTTNDVLPDTWNKCKAELVNDDDEEKLILNFDSCTVISTVTTDYQLLKDLLSSRSFCIDFKINDDENLLGCLYILKLPLPKITNKFRSVIKTVFSLVHSISCEYNEINTIQSSLTTEHYNDLYKNIAAIREDIPLCNVSHCQLKPELRPYQQSAVRWMLHRERSVENSEKLHPLYEKVTLPSGVELFYDKYTGEIEVTEPVVAYVKKGGILADEMGLGKTVEVLALILLNKRSQVKADGENPTENIVESTPECPSTSQEIRQTTIKEEEPDTEEKDTEKMDTEKTEEEVNLQTIEMTTPTVATPCRKRRARRERTFLDDYKTMEKKLKTNGNKSNLRIALESWYTRILGPRSPAVEETGIRCICGEVDERDTVDCAECKKIQHANCLGYKKKYGPYLCPQCWTQKPLVESGATLIVTPTFLKQQWCDEICKHIGGKFRVLQYGSGQNIKNIYPAELKEYDIVITTYSILQSELRLSENGQPVSLRRPPKYSLPGSPLTLVNWWRLCLDEAQTVETPGSMISVMAKKLSAHHRWAVTGTPISKDISDLYGLVDYLQMSPYSERETWDNLFYKPYINNRKAAMHTFLSQMLWRTAKNDVLDQINIPLQTTQEYWVEFTAVEKFFYNKEHELSCKEFLYKLRNMDIDVPLKMLNKSALKKIMMPLLALRQACVHHQTVKGRYLATCKQVSSMEDLLDALIAKSLAQCEEHIRTVISAMNGLASVHLLEQNPPAAAQMYRKVLALADEYSSKNTEITMEIDRLQMVHALYNLVEILDLYPGIPRTPGDDGLKEKWRQLEKGYLERLMSQLVTVMEDNSKIYKQIETQQAKFTLPPGQWFADMFDWVSTNRHFRDFTNKLETLAGNASVAIDPASLGERSTFYKVANWDEKIGTLKVKTKSAIEKLLVFDEDRRTYTIPMSIINSAAKCHLRQDKKSKNKKYKGVDCLICDASNYLNEYESVLFSSEQRLLEDKANAGSWKPAAEEFMIKALFACGKSNKVSKDLLHDGELHLDILELIRKEFKEIRKLWTFIDSVVCFYDELDMCKIRLQIREPDENDDNTANAQQNRAVKALTEETTNRLADIYYLQAAEIPYQLAHLSSQERSGLKMLEAGIGTYKYLQTLRKQQTKGEDFDPCPICKCVLDTQWNILTCGHCYCIECVQTLIGQQIGRYRLCISCAICRKSVIVSEISYIHKDDKKKKSGDDQIKGNCSSKVEAVVKLVLDLKKTDPDVKVLVFSNWAALLNLMHPIFEANNITSQVLLSARFDKTFESFKDMKKGITALLLPVNLGSKGLNIIEATHVIFVEPLLNPADELQAIGRVHRIGQTKPTVVHKFFMKNTIEESIYHTMSTDTEKWDANNVTLGQIKQLFEYGNFDVHMQNYEEMEIALDVDDSIDSDVGGSNSAADLAETETADADMQ